MLFEKKSKNISNVICNLGIFGFMFLFGGMYTYVYFYGTALLETCIMVFIGSTLLVIQYYFLRDLNFKERIPEILIIIITNILSLFIIKENIALVAVVIGIATAACILINRKKIEKFYV
ncbi:hypothetical protein COC69_31735 [Bacillus cereus]|uniref:Uncharacterized protein n=1 Tax=Bacillus cereus TaxID=1396 RepID=A0A9X7CGU7_BACCE|nr:hypothetical protein [Bacillus cereus]PGS63296.1 hypothetical protein COC69_31735 [Bacillus cereus]